MSPDRERLLDHFREQSRLCAALGSPFTAELIARLGDDLEAGGPTAEVVGDWPGHPRKDAVSLRLAGALHFAVLSGRDEALRAVYPAARPDWTMGEVWPRARDLLAREPDRVRRFLASAPQTNEVRRSIALLAGFLHLAAERAKPLEVLELGASAGLNVLWDRFCYETASWRWGAPSPVRVDTDWRGPAPPTDAPLHVRARAACDARPLDLADTAQRLRLKSYIWADQPERLARFDGAAELALAEGVRVERADAAEWLAPRLARRASDATTVVVHSVFLQYPPRATREAIEAAIAEAGERATAEAPLAWLRLEPEALLGGPLRSGRFLLALSVWPGGARRDLAATDGHVRSVEALG